MEFYTRITFNHTQEPWVPSSQDGEWNDYADIVFTVNHSRHKRRLLPSEWITI
ncbi:MAG: hypothetical protein NTX45_27450 [Proteobacteria bacterium]|nr:hypothetical protein [Pseudomonadota bacterium]